MTDNTRPVADETTGAYAKIADAPESWPVERSEERFRGAKCGIVTDWVEMPGANGDGRTLATRDYMDHPGASAIVALDARGRVLLQRQYRHPTQHTMWELPAGLIDGEGEGPLATARRELVEESSLSAATWHKLPDFFPSTGFSNERIHVFLARDLSEVPAEEIDFVREHEETDLAAEWLPLPEAVRAVLEGRLHNGATVIGILAAHAAFQDGFASLPVASDD